ncbi:NAD-dependent epimerase/dehydratase [Spirochaeta thermophila DSM 6578]|uniref:GDP-L-fucose synthase n=1 Tax=Winmispira thermophila (strain ATCC 700085 / DSM 6578 / Z-1203) TaxID=869211 RepID=G0GB74_WINT7|nr:GDP-L-fucose synthase [Spirochaeta thermophila]AEJ61883.1 NAD-dependent epimerase/dehydratase [Spirochaeta thermophila DSM 6578]
MEKESKIYVAGHRGLVGAALVQALRKKGYTNILTKTHSELDLTDQEAVSRFFENEKPEYVFLAAAKVGGIWANNLYRAEFIYQNLMIQSNVIHQSYLHGVKKLLFLGSTCIYPRLAPQPMKEEYLLTGELEYTNEPYAIAKIAGMRMCESYNLQYGTNFISVMPTNLYGPNDNFDLETSHVLPALLRKFHLAKALQQENWELIRADLSRRPLEERGDDISEGEILTLLEKYGVRKSSHGVEVEIWGTGRPRREFLWVDDLADACVFLMEHVDFEDIVKKFLGGQQEIRNTHINIGTGEDISIRDLAELMKEVVGFKGDIVFNPEKPDGTPVKRTDVSRLHSLGWRHSVGLREGVERLYEWYVSSLEMGS